MRSGFVTRLMRAPAEAMRANLATLMGGAAPAGLAASYAARLQGAVAAAEHSDAAAPQHGFTRHTYAGPDGTRPYWLFVPDTLKPAPALIVMLHGCTQGPEDFAAGTRMNTLAAQAGALVLYPAQTSAANAQRCWNWFSLPDQQRTGGEAALIAGMTRAVMASHHVDPGRVFAAGLSAGGALAAILGATQPDLFAAVGVHSGLACGAATDLGSAFKAMAQGRPGRGTHRTRTIVFHGDRDNTVSARNAELVAEQASPGGTLSVEHGQVPGGLAYTRHIERDAAGQALVERWTVHGAGHAWSGGDRAGSYTEPRGPDASAAMMGFFGI